MEQKVALISNADIYVGPDACQALSDQGFKVVCHSVGFSDDSARAAFSKNNPDFVILKSIEAGEAVSETEEITGRIDVLVNNHFRGPEIKPLEANTADDYRQMLETLLVAPFDFARAVTPVMKQQEGGRIIMVTSAAPLMPGAYVSMYTSARGGANLLVKSMAKELGPFNISVFSICPNFYASKDTYSQEEFENNDQFREYVEKNVPLKRLSAPEEMRELIAFLASGRSEFITGQIFSFSGGWA